MEKTPPVNLEQTLDRIADAEARDGAETSVKAIVVEFGRRSFGPMLLFPGLVTLLPTGGIPGVPTIMGLFVTIVAVQLLCGRHYFWLPDWILKRSVDREKLRKSRSWVRRPARFIDRLLRARLTWFTDGPAVYLIAFLSALMGLLMPPMELIPFTATSGGLALTLFGLALLANDGLLALFGIVITTATISLVVFNVV